MPVRLRLSRHGRKGRPFYYIVAADSRAPRDGKFLEKVGTYNPITDPATIEVDHEKALKWLSNGAQPSDTVRSILRYSGVNLKFALKKQGKSQEQIDSIYSKWLTEKEAKISGKKQGLADAKAKAEAERLANEAKIREERAAAIAAKNAPPVEETPAEEAPAEDSTVAESAAEEAPAEESAE